jgi:hypothetical protein
MQCVISYHRDIYAHARRSGRTIVLCRLVWPTFPSRALPFCQRTDCVLAKPCPLAIPITFYLLFIYMYWSSSKADVMVQL